MGVPDSDSMHTPGPWKVRKDQGELEVWRHEPNELPVTRVARIVRQPCPIDHGDHVCNAHLIAAAPELLQACEKAADFFEQDGYCVDELRKVIAKAKGVGRAFT